MQYAKLGRTGLKVSRLCLGTMNFGPHASEQESFAIMDRALDLGINFFDTADVYGWKKGEGITEKILGAWFAQGGEAAREGRARDEGVARWRTGRTDQALGAASVAPAKTASG
jgi:aryl-alcohol dehydrogenase-like predicted oxidoreductase